MNKYIDSFLDEFERPENSKVPDVNYIASYKGKLPEELLEFWSVFGFCSFLDGLFSIVDPQEYASILEDWFKRVGISLDDDKYYIIGKSGFGDLYIYAAEQGYCYKLNSMNGWLIKQNNNSIDYFFSGLCTYTVDLEDLDTDEDIFKPAVEKFGKLDKDEMFGFVPSLVAGGEITLDNVEKVNLQIHLDIILQLTEPKIITIDDLKSMAFN